jgi:hypothetical protein
VLFVAQVTGDQVGPKFPSLKDRTAPLCYEELLPKLEAGKGLLDSGGAISCFE